jgi:hypothetical protein
MASLLRFPMELMQIDQYGVFSDFVDAQSDLFFVDTVTDSGTVAVADGVRGIMTLDPSDGTVADNDEAYLASANEIFKVAENKNILGVAYIQFTEANTDDANVAFGFQNAVGANSILDDGAGLKVSGDTFAIYKVDGGTVWKCVSCVNGTSTVSTSTTTAGGSSYQKLSIEIVNRTSLGCSVIFKCDGLPLKDSTTGLDIVHTALYASATEMEVFVGVKNGDTNQETLLVDYLGAWQER